LPTFTTVIVTHINFTSRSYLVVIFRCNEIQHFPILWYKMWICSIILSKKYLQSNVLWYKMQISSFMLSKMYIQSNVPLIDTKCG
jgi:hypothetical protein